MKISTILDHIDSGHVALPEFQRGYVWNRDQVRALFDSLYLRHPVGGLLVWATDSAKATHRGDQPLAQGVVKLLLDGQQRITTLYGVIRGKAPAFFDGNEKTFSGLFFHLENEIFSFYQPLKMQDDPLWIDVTALMIKGNDGFGDIIKSLQENPALSDKLHLYAGRISQILGIREIDVHVEEITGEDKTIDVVVDIFNRVNSGGTKLSKGDLALAKICADWPKARDTMKASLKYWRDWNGIEDKEFNFGMDWLLRSVNVIVTGEAKFQFLHDKDAKTIQYGVTRAVEHINTCLNKISDRLGLDHDQVLFGRFGIPVMVRFLDKAQQPLDGATWDKLLFWYAQAGMWGRFSGSTETVIDKDLEALEDHDGGLDALLEQLRLWNGSLCAEPAHFAAWSVGARFYPVLYMLTRMGAARDWGLGVELKAHMLGKMSRLEVHHIFPKAKLYKHTGKYTRAEVNSLGNFCFLTKETNLDISDTLPEIYFPMVEANHPGALASQWIPMEPELWKIENFREFLVARQRLLAQELDRRMRDLLHGDEHWLEPVARRDDTPAIVSMQEDEDIGIEQLNAWMLQRNLPAGQPSFELTDEASGKRFTIDLAWPEGVQAGLSDPVALFLNASDSALAGVSQAGYRCFTDITSFQRYVERDILC